MNPRNISKSIFLTFLALLLFHCESDILSNDWDDQVRILQNSNEQLVAVYKYETGELRFNSELTQGRVTSTLEVTVETGEKIRLKNTLDPTVTSYRLDTHNDVVNESKVLLNKVNKHKILSDLALQIESFAKSILLAENINHSSALVQVLFIHNAIINTALRSNTLGDDCECTPHPGYFVDKTPFWCQEDYLVDIRLFINTIESSEIVLSEREHKILNYLKDAEYYNEKISIDKLFSLTESKEHFNRRVENRFLVNNKIQTTIATDEDCFLGSDIGCCGNYEGCCWYSSLFCLWHDAACTACSKWHCGPGCEPEV